MPNVFQFRPTLVIGLLAALYPLSSIHAEPNDAAVQEIGQLEDA